MTVVQQVSPENWLKTVFSPFPKVTADTRVLMSGLTVFEILDAVKRNKNVKMSR